MPTTRVENHSAFVDFSAGERKYQLVLSGDEDLGARAADFSDDTRAYFLHLGKLKGSLPVSGYPDDPAEVGPFLESLGEAHLSYDAEGNFGCAPDELRYREDGVLGNNCAFISLLNAFDPAGKEFSREQVASWRDGPWKRFKPMITSEGPCVDAAWVMLAATLFPRKVPSVLMDTSYDPDDLFLPPADRPAILVYEAGPRTNHAVASVSADKVRTIFTDSDGQRYLIPRVPDEKSRFYHTIVRF